METKGLKRTKEVNKMERMNRKEKERHTGCLGATF